MAENRFQMITDIKICSPGLSSKMFWVLSPLLFLETVTSSFHASEALFFLNLYCQYFWSNRMKFSQKLFVFAVFAIKKSSYKDTATSFQSHRRPQTNISTISYKLFLTKFLMPFHMHQWSCQKSMKLPFLIPPPHFFICLIQLASSGPYGLFLAIQRALIIRYW